MQQTDNAANLQPQDIAYCETLFKSYLDHYKFISELADLVYVKYNIHLVEHPGTEPFTGQLENVRDIKVDLLKTLQKLTAQLGEKIEAYFTGQYNIKFEPLDLQKQRNGIPLDSYQPLIENITKQLGNDFAAAGEKQVIKRFQELFCFDRNRPFIKNDKISFPSLGQYDIDSDNDLAWLQERENIPLLMDALTLFCMGRTTQPETFKSQYYEWRGGLQFSIWYLLSGEMNLSIRFYKNEKVVVMFKDDETAESFWNAFELENIVEKNRQKNN